MTKSLTKRQRTAYVSRAVRMIAKQYDLDTGGQVSGEVRLFSNIIRRGLDDLFPSKGMLKGNEDAATVAACAKHYLTSGLLDEHADYCGIEADWIRRKLNELEIL